MLCDICLRAFSSHGPILRTAPEDATFREHTLSDGSPCNLAFQEKQWVPHHPSFSSLKASVDLNCLICTAFWNRQRPSVTRWLESESSPLGSETQLRPNLTPAIDIVQPGTRIGIRTSIEPVFEPTSRLKHKAKHNFVVDGYPVNEESNYLEQFYAYTGIGLQPEVTFRTPNITHCSTTLESPEVLSKVKYWIDHCKNTHHTCSSPANWYPTRLLDSGPLETSTKIFVRLRETAFPAPSSTETVIDGPYMTLSYCWGTEACLTLTKHTYPKLISGIALDDLPKAFRDAICICRGVGVRYLWIDALCIFQDKDDEQEISDWQREASQMHKIYSHTLCNISAAAGVGSSSPILRSRAPDTLHQDEIEIQWLNADNTVSSSSYRLVDEWLWIHNIVNAPVNRRAWVIQERMLSPRIIHFANSQIYWECFRKRASEVYPHVWPCKDSEALILSKRHDEKLLPSKDNDQSWPSREDSLREIHKQWCSLVETYTDCQLTVQTDKLVAISAIARRMATYFQDDYLAGMWRQSLEHSLVWSKMSPALETTDLASYVAPTWSWASTEGKIVLPGGMLVGEWPPVEGDRLFAEVEDVQLEYLSNDVFGALRGGRLRLRGVLQRIQLLPRFPTLDWDDLSSEEVEKCKERWFSPFIGAYSIVINGKRATRGDTNTDRNRYKRYEKENREGVLFCILIYKYTDPVPYPWVFLLLEVVCAADGTFRRIGRTCLDQGEADSELTLSRHNEEACFPCIEYRDHQHSIWII